MPSSKEYRVCLWMMLFASILVGSVNRVGAFAQPPVSATEQLTILSESWTEPKIAVKVERVRALIVAGVGHH